MRETTEFGQRIQEFEDLHTKVVGVSVDTPAAQKKHAIRCSAGYPLLSDVGRTLTGELGILNERGSALRTTYLVDRTGTIRRVFNKVKVDGHVDAVLNAAKEIQ